MIKKVLHKVIVCWCLYGLYLVLVTAHPWLFWVAARIKPYFDANENWDRLDPVPWNPNSWGQSMLVWFCAIVICSAVVAAYVGLTSLCEHVFVLRESTEEE